jgi:hypothetical protein
MFRHNREKRYNELIKAGFRHFEAQWLSQIPLMGHPGMSHIIRRRRKLLEKRIREADKKGWSQAKRERVWNKRTKMLYRRRHWICRSDHPTGMGPRAGECDPFELYRLYERSEINPLPGDSGKRVDRRSDSDRRWELNRAQILLLRAKWARQYGDQGKYLAALGELDDTIQHSSGKKKEMLTAARNKVARH